MTNKFAAILNARQTPTADETPAPTAAETAPPLVTIAPAIRPQRKQAKPAAPDSDAPAPIVAVKGRGKRSDPNFCHVTVYFPRELHSNAVIALRLANQTRIDAEKEDFSELVTRLLANWYEKQTYYKPNA